MEALLSGQRRLLTLLLACLGLLCPPSGWAAPLEEARGAIEQAKALEQALQSAQPQDVPGMRAAVQDHLKTAREYFEAAGAVRMGQDGFIEYIGVLFLLEYHDLAAAALETAVATHPEDARLWMLLGQARLETGPEGFRDAIPALRRAVEMDSLKDSDRASARSLLGEAYYRAGLFEHAEAEYALALEADNEAVEAIIGLSILDIRAGRLLQGATRLDGLGMKALPYDGRIRVRTRDALVVAESNGLRVDDTSESHGAYARTMYRAGRVSTAILAVQRAIAQDPSNPEWLNFLGGMYHQLGNVAGAKEAFEQSLALKADQPGIRSALDQLNALPPSQLQP